MKSIILNAIKSLYESINYANLTMNEVDVLKQLMIKLIDYYEKWYNYFEEHTDGDEQVAKKRHLDAQMTDFIVAINDTINGKNQVVPVMNMIYKEINYDSKKGRFKRKRLFK